MQNFYGANQTYSLSAKKSDIAVTADFAIGNTMPTTGDSTTYIVSVENNTKHTIKNVMLKGQVPDYLKVQKVYTYEKEFDFTNENGTLLVELGDISDEETEIRMIASVDKLPANYQIAHASFHIWSTDNEEKVYDSNVVHFEVGQADLKVTQTINNTKFKFGDPFEIHVIVENKSRAKEAIRIVSDVPRYLNIKDTKLICNGETKQLYSSNDVESYIEIEGEETVELIFTGRTTMTHELEEDLNYTSIFTAKGNSGSEIRSNPIELVIYAVKDEQSEDNKETGYSISGNVYADISGNIKSQVQVQLLKDSNMVQATTTDSYGNYSFQGLKEGEYSVVYTYDEDSYISNPETSETVEIEEGVAITDTLKVENSSLSNVNAGLVEKEKFDLKVDQYLSHASIQIEDENEVYDFENLSLAKLEIDPKDIDKAVVKLTYKIVVTNVGTVSGRATSIVDYIPNGMTFYQSENENWSAGVIEGSVYNDELKGIDIAPGESKEVTLVLTKNMTENNTGVVSNKVRIAYSESNLRLTESISNNFASQETIITLTQGISYKVIGVIGISMITIIGVFGFMVSTGRIEVSFNLKKGIKKIYK